MSKLSPVFALTVAFSAAGDNLAKIDVRTLVVPSVKQHVIDKSDRGKRRERWQLNAPDTAVVEAIGDDPAAVDVLAVHCADYDGGGSRIDVASPGARCRTLYLQVLSHYTKAPATVLDALIAARGKGGDDATMAMNAIGLELAAEGDFMFLRK